MSKVVTKSKFGAPSKPLISKFIEKTTEKQSICTPLPPISSLQKNFPSNKLDEKTAENYSFSNNLNHGIETTFESLITLTPPTSPIGPNNNCDINNQLIPTLVDPSLQPFHHISQDDTRVRTASLSGNVGNLVDEHFRNCGIEQFTTCNKIDGSALNLTVRSYWLC